MGKKEVNIIFILLIFLLIFFVYFFNFAYGGFFKNESKIMLLALMIFSLMIVILFINIGEDNTLELISMLILSIIYGVIAFGLYIFYKIIVSSFSIELFKSLKLYIIFLLIGLVFFIIDKTLIKYLVENYIDN